MKRQSANICLRGAGRFCPAVLLLLMLMLAACTSDEGPADPVAPTPAISIADRSVAEGNTLLFTISLDQATDHPVVYTYTTIDVTATAPDDYYAAAATDTIAAGETSATLLVISVDDLEVESTETFSVSLTSITGATAARSLATGTITDNDPTDVSYSLQVQPLLRTSCGSVACHGGTFAGGLYFGTNAEWSTLINATGSNTGLLPGSPDGKVIQPGDRSISTLFMKIDTTQAPPFGSRMPAGGAVALDFDEQNLIGLWIDQGAEDN